MKNIGQGSPNLVNSCILCICLLLSTITIALQAKLAKREKDKGSNNYRLPRHIVPINYKLHLRPNIQYKTFDGNVNITIKTLKPTNVITLHSDKLIIHSVYLKSSSGSLQNIVKSSNLINDSREFLNIYLQHEIPVDQFVLDINFSGNLSGLVGLYASKLKSSKSIRTGRHRASLQKKVKKYIQGGVRGSAHDAKQVSSQSQHNTQDRSQEVVKDVGYGSTRKIAQENEQENDQNNSPDSAQSSAHDRVYGITRSFFQNSVEYRAQENTEDREQDSAQDNAQNRGHNRVRATRSLVQISAEYRPQDWEPDSVQNSAQYSGYNYMHATHSLVQNNAEYILQDSAQDNDQDRIQDSSQFTQNSGPNRGHASRGVVQNSAEYKSQDSAFDSDQDIVQDSAQFAQNRGQNRVRATRGLVRNSAEYRPQDSSHDSDHDIVQDSAQFAQNSGHNRGHASRGVVQNSAEYKSQDSAYDSDQDIVQDSAQFAQNSGHNRVRATRGLIQNSAEYKAEDSAQDREQYSVQESIEDYSQDSNAQGSAQDSDNPVWRAKKEQTKRTRQHAWESMMVANQFEATFARQAFPCFDEPDFKATFNITLTVPKSYVALSNMNEISRVNDVVSGMESVTFAQSLPMATYVTAVVICDFDFKETEVKSNGIGENFALRSFARKGKTNQIDYSLDIGKRVTEFYIKYYKVPYPLPKLDMIAIPDFRSGAMEHWGLVTYRETSFLVDEATASSMDMVIVAKVVTHELAHMWFGNLVTMKWWDEIWLNEGFARFMEIKSLDAVEPSWTMRDQFLLDLHSVLTVDAYESSHPIVKTVRTPEDIAAIFDTITYNKGAALLRMLEGIVGEKWFRRGVSDYLKKNKYGNTDTQDFLKSMEPHFKTNNRNLDLKYIMATWTRQMGYPLLTVTKSKEPNTYAITQSRFLLNPNAVYRNGSEFDYRWFIPYTYKTNRASSEKVLWLSDQVDKVTLKLKSNERWLKINNDQVGYYRVNYPDDMWRSLIEQLKENTNTKLTIADRAHLLNEVFALAEGRVVPYKLAMNLTLYLPEERDFVPWTIAAGIFSDLAARLFNTSGYDNLMTHVQSLIMPLYEAQSWEKDSRSVIDRLLRWKVLRTAAWCSLPDAVQRVRTLLHAWLEDPAASPIEPDLRDFVYVEGMKTATQDEWDRMWEIFKREEDAQEQAKLRAALAAPRDTDILRKYLKLSWDENNIRRQDYLSVMQSIAGNPVGTSLVWHEVQAKWPQLVERFSLDNQYLARLFPSISRTFNTDDQLKEMEKFVTQYPEAGVGEITRKLALETVRNNVRWHKTQEADVIAWLSERTTGDS